MKKLVIVGCGRLAGIVADAVVKGLLPDYDLVGVYSRTASKAAHIVHKMQQHGKPCIACATLEELLALKPDYLVESASPAAMRELALPALRNGTSVITLSIGALADETFYREVAETANPYKIEQVVVMSGMYVAEVTNGTEKEETLLSKEEGKIFYTVGNAFDGTEEKYLCTKEDLEKFEEALMEQEGRTLADLPEGRVVEEAVYEARMKRTGILEQVQSQELQKSMKQDPIIQREPELMIS